MKKSRKASGMVNAPGNSTYGDAAALSTTPLPRLV